MYHDATPAPLMVAADERRFSGYDMSASLLSNSSRMVAPLESLVTHASALVGSGAYLHQYQKYGLEREELEQALVTVEEALGRYQLLRSAAG